MSLLLELVFRTLFDLGREARLRDKNGPRSLRYSLAISYYVLPTLFIVSILISWKIAAIVAGAFIASLIVGAMTEADDPKFH